MKTFNMYVRTVITSEHGKILLLKQKRMDKRNCWELPGVPLSSEESFDEVITNLLPEVTGYYIYPGKIVGVAGYHTKELNEIHVILEGTILHGELLLSKHYERCEWIPPERLREYPLAPWFDKYLRDNRKPFTDVEKEISYLTEIENQRMGIFRENIVTETEESFDVDTEGIGESIKDSWNMLKNTIKRTFHPKEAEIEYTEPKENPIYEYYEEYDDTDENLEDIYVSNSDDIHPETYENYNPNEVEEEIPSEEIDTIIIDNDEEINLDKEEELVTHEPIIQKINEKEPIIRKEKESTSRISFNSSGRSSSNKRYKKSGKLPQPRRRK